MRIALYGGSFDPVHLGHLLAARAVHEELRVDRVVFIPAAQSPFKPDRQLSSDQARLAMLRLALAGSPWAEVDDQELQRGGVSYTIDTIHNYQNRFPGAELFYLIGTDHVPHLPKWREAATLAAALQFIVIPRPGETEHPFPPPFRGSILTGFPLQLSSSQIRARARAGLPLTNLVPPAVAEYIASAHLYS